MPNIQTDTSDEALIAAIRLNMGDFFRYVSRLNPTEHFETDDFVRWYSPLPHPWFNGVLSLTPPTAQAEAFITATIEYFRARNVGAFTWWLEPPLRPTDWELALTRQGFSFSAETPGMAVDLHGLNESLGAVKDLEIQVVADAESLRSWVEVFVHGYGLPESWLAPTLDLWGQLGFELPIRNYLGYLKGKPVSTSMLFYGGGAAGIYCVATLPEARGQGLGAALTLQPLLAARTAGYRIGILQSSEMGYGVYKKLGFRHLCEIEIFQLSLR